MLQFGSVGFIPWFTNDSLCFVGNTQKSESVHNNSEALLTSEVCYCYLAKFSYKEYIQGFTGEKMKKQYITACTHPGFNIVCLECNSEASKENSIENVHNAFLNRS